MSSDKMIKVLDHGWVKLIDHMGDDKRIVDTARQSYGEGTRTVNDDRNLIRYLMRHWHTSPFESVEFQFQVKAPIFVFRQWFRHRTQCLSGDTIIHVFNVEVSDFWRSIRLEDFVKSQKPSSPRQFDIISFDHNNTPFRSRVLGGWCSGHKEVFEVKDSTGKISIKATKDHLFYTDKGWLRLGDAYESGASLVLSRPNIENYNVIRGRNVISKQWDEEFFIVKKSLCGNELIFHVSSLGEIFHHGRKLEPFDLACIGMNFVDILKEAYGLDDFPRLDGNPDNLTLRNQTTPFEFKNTGKKNVSLLKNWTMTSVGVEPVYDIEVDSPWHNFLANGRFIVHNSVNEYSGRYSIMPEEMFSDVLPQPQSKSNNQGRDGTFPEDEANEISDTVRGALKASRDVYDNLLDRNLSREQARIVLPLAQYSVASIKTDLHNLMHFLRLREDGHAQEEIRAYARAIRELITPIVPLSMEAFDDYRVKAVNFSKQELNVIKWFLMGISDEDLIYRLEQQGVSKRELKEFLSKIR